MKKLFRRPSLLLFLAAVLVYSANGRAIGSGDTLPARYLPFSLLRERDFDLDEFPFLYGEEVRRTSPLIDGIPYFLRYRDGHYLSAYPPGAAVLALPIYLLPVLAGLPPDSPWVPSLEKLTATIITALSVVFLFWALCELVALRWALGIAFIYAFGTSSFSVSSQALWQHGPSQFFLALLLYLLVKGMKEERYLPYTGFALAAAAAMRPINLLLALPLGIVVLSRHRHLLGRFFLFALSPSVPLLLYNLFHFGSLLGADYGHVHVALRSFFTQIPLYEGGFGLLFSPTRGLFVYSSVLLLSLLGIGKIWKTGPILLKALSLGPLPILLVYSKWFMWWGGHSFGPRMLADLTPIFCFFLYPLCDHLERRRLLKGTFFLLAGLSISAHALGAFFYDGRWDRVAEIDRNYPRLWSWKGSPLAYHGWEALFHARQLVSSVARGLLRPPTSSDAPQLLAASYTVKPIPPQVFPGEPIPISLRATNTGRAVWLASSKGDRGTVRLGWRWFRGDREIAAGREPLPSDVFPGGSFRFAVWMIAPPDPGDYTLVLELVSELVTWFSDQDVEPVKVAVRVLSPDFHQLTAEPPEVGGASPALAIATDRPWYRRGEVLHLTVELVNPHRPQSLDVYLALRGPDGRVFFFDGHGLFPSDQGPWAAWVKGIPLPAQAAGRFTLPLSGLSPGPYTWHLVLTESQTYHVRAKAATTFTLEP